MWWPVSRPGLTAINALDALWSHHAAHVHFECVHRKGYHELNSGTLGVFIDPSRSRQVLIPYSAIPGIGTVLQAFVEQVRHLAHRHWSILLHCRYLGGLTAAQSGPKSPYKPFQTIPKQCTAPYSDHACNLSSAIHRYVASVQVLPDSQTLELQNGLSVHYDWLVLCPGSTYADGPIKNFGGSCEDRRAVIHVRETVRI